MGDSPTVDVRDLGMRSRRGPVYQDVSFEASSGELVALLGPTGSGKTALALTLAGRMRPTSGSARILGHDVVRGGRRIRDLVGLGLISGVNDLDDQLSVGAHLQEQLLLLGDKGSGRAYSLLELVELSVPHHTRVRDLDAEQRLRLGLALGLAHPRRILIADDMDHDLNPEQQARVWRLLHTLTDDGLTVFAGCIDPRAAANADSIVQLAGPSPVLTHEPAREALHAIA